MSSSLRPSRFKCHFVLLRGLGMRSYYLSFDACRPPRRGTSASGTSTIEKFASDLPPPTMRNRMKSPNPSRRRARFKGPQSMASSPSSRDNSSTLFRAFSLSAATNACQTASIPGGPAEGRVFPYGRRQGAKTSVRGDMRVGRKVRYENRRYHPKQSAG